MSQGLKTRRVKSSRKIHSCSGCDCKIPKGSAYTYFVGIYEGDFYSGHMCDICDKFISKYPRLFDDVEFEEGSLPEYSQYAGFKKQYHEHTLR